MATQQNTTKSGYLSAGRLVKRLGSKYWYMRFTDSAGRRVFRSTKHTDEAKARCYLAEYSALYSNGAPMADWKSYIERMLNTQRSWVREMLNSSVARERVRNPGTRVRELKRQLVDVLIRSNGKCELTEIPFSLENPNGARVRPFVASIDRIDSSQGYSYKNCRAVCACVNMALSDWGDDVFRMVCTGYASKMMRDTVLRSGGPVFRPACESSDANIDTKAYLHLQNTE